MGGSSPLLLILDIADIEHEPDQTPMLTGGADLALNPIPRRRCADLRAVQTHAQGQRFSLQLQGAQTAAQFVAIGGMKQRQPVFYRQQAIAEIQCRGQRRRQRNLLFGSDFPPASAEQVLQGIKTLHRLHMALLAQAAEQRSGQRTGQGQPVAIGQPWRHVVDRVKPAKQPCDHALIIAVGHSEPVGVAERGLQSRMFIAALRAGEALRCAAVEAVQRRAQWLAVLPQLRGVVGTKLLMNLPALGLFIQQGHGEAGDVPALGDGLQLFAKHRRQTRQAARAQAIADLRGEGLAGVAVARLLTFEQQVGDVEQLQSPAILQRLHPAAQVQRLIIQSGEIQIEQLPVPVPRLAFDAQQAMRQQIGAKRQRLTLRFVLGEQMPQRAGDLQHGAVAIQIKMQADRRRAEVVRQVVGCDGGALEQAPEKLIAGGQNCRLERAVRCVGRLGTVPIPGSTRNGMI